MVKNKEEKEIEKQEREEAKKEMKMWMANDWDLVEETPEFFKLKKNTQTLGGHLLVFIFTVWWTFGLGNLVYYLLSNKTKKVLK